MKIMTAFSIEVNKPVLKSDGPTQLSYILLYCNTTYNVP